MIQLTLLVAVAAISASPAPNTTRHRIPPAVLQTQAVLTETDEIGPGVLRKTQYNAPPINAEPLVEYSESMPVDMGQASVLQYEATPVNYGSSEAYYDRTSRRSDNYYHGCEQHIGIWSKHCLPSPWCCPGNMAPHFAYEAMPHFYYYFRPYNAAQIGPQQVVAEAWVSNPRTPYSNDVFDEVYRGFDAKFAPPVAPLVAPPAAPPVAPIDPLTN